MSWILHVTAATVIEKNGKFLLVKELVGDKLTYNQPAGHLEENESLTDAAARETYEETGLRFTPRTVTGVYHWQNPHARDTYIRVAFTGDVDESSPVAIPDKKILGTEWLSLDEIKALPTDNLRSSMVIRCIEDYQAGARYSLDLISYLNDRGLTRK